VILLILLLSKESYYKIGKFIQEMASIFIILFYVILEYT